MTVDNKALNAAIEQVVRDEIAKEFRELVVMGGSVRLGNIYAAYLKECERRREEKREYIVAGAFAACIIFVLGVLMLTRPV
jgi:inosine-uridine nucleoside N-ribohydrolase